MSNENKELNDILSHGYTTHARKVKAVRESQGYPAMANEESKVEVSMANLVQWTTGDNKRFVPASHTKESLTPGVYEIQHSSQIGIYFEKIPVKTEGLLRFPQTNSDKILSEIQKFWEREDIFHEYKLTYKRGIILWGPPGGGKSCTLQLIMKDVIDREGIVVKFTQPGVFLEGMRILREIEKETPVVIIMEDIDAILERWPESDVLNILDGVDAIERAIFLATTNYPERLGGRILNRPSRFDKRFKIDHPNTESRRMYFEYIIGGPEKVKALNINLNKWVKDSDKFSIAHLKELFVAVVILGDDYDQAIETLQSMKEVISSEDDSDRFMGFGGYKMNRENDN